MKFIVEIEVDEVKARELFFGEDPASEEDLRQKIIEHLYSGTSQNYFIWNDVPLRLS